MKALRKLAPKLGVSVHWLETGRDDPAEQLARMVRDGHGQPISDEALALANEILAADGSAPASIQAQRVSPSRTIAVGTSPTARATDCDAAWSGWTYAVTAAPRPRSHATIATAASRA